MGFHPVRTTTVARLPIAPTGRNCDSKSLLGRNQHMFPANVAECLRQVWALNGGRQTVNSVVDVLAPTPTAAVWPLPRVMACRAELLSIRAAIGRAPCRPERNSSVREAGAGARSSTQRVSFEPPSRVFSRNP
jgi:hypothetical protein